MENQNKKTFMQQLIHQKGKRFYGGSLPDDIERGRVGDCFDHCLMAALKSNGKYRYCEGFAFHGKRAIHHAWLTDEKGLNAYDPTWNAIKPDGTEIPMHMISYIGVVLDMMLVAKFVSKTEYKSPLANHYRDPELAQKIYDTAL